MLDDGVINLTGKSLSKPIHWFLDILTKMLSFYKHALIFENAVNARTYNL